MKEDTFEFYLKPMGIESFIPREEMRVRVPCEKTSSPEQEWQILAQEVKGCVLCPLHKSRTNTVFGSGNLEADVVFVGEAPGAKEDLQGQPFVGRAGELFTHMLKAIGFKRSQVFICNILKCRPPQNRDPLAPEVIQCTPYLERQLALLKPQLIVALGRIASHFLLQCKTPLGRLRGEQFSYHHIPLIVTYHPAYLLRNPKDKRKSYEDLLKIRDFLGKNSLS